MKEFLGSLVEMAEQSWEKPHHFPGSVDWEASVARRTSSIRYKGDCVLIIICGLRRPVLQMILQQSQN